MATKTGVLTAKGIAAMAPGEWAADPAPRGAGRLQVRKLVGTQAAYYYRYTAPDGSRDRLPIGSGISLTDARALASQLSQRYQRGDRDLRGAIEAEKREAERSARAAEVARATKAEASLGALMLAYVDSLRAEGKVSARGTETAVDLHIKSPWPALWSKPADDLVLEDLLPVVARVVAAGKLREAGKVRSYIRAAYAAAIRARQDARSIAALRDLNISTNPARDLATIDGGSNARERSLSLAELRGYWRRISTAPGAGAAMLRFHLLTGGQRIAQLARLQIDGLDADSETVCLLDTKGRRKKPRRHFVPLIPAAMAALQDMRGDALGPYLFTISHGDAPASYDVFRGMLDPIVSTMDMAGELEGAPFTPGDLRRTIETRLAAVGQSEEARGQLQSHGLGGVQKRHYNMHEYAAEKRAALTALFKLLTTKPAPVSSIARRRVG